MDLTGLILHYYCSRYFIILLPRSLDDPPDHPAFKTGRAKRPNQVQALTTAVTEMAKAVTAAGSGAPPSSGTASTLPSQTSPITTAGISPGKIANLRSNYLQQIRDLHSLYENGAITEIEFQEQKLPILEHLKKLSATYQ